MKKEHGIFDNKNGKLLYKGKIPIILQNKNYIPKNDNDIIQYSFDIIVHSEEIK